MPTIPPPNILGFSVKTTFEPKITFFLSQHEQKVLDVLEVHDSFKKEFTRMLIANSFVHEDKLICSFEAFYSIGRLLFSLNAKATVQDWPLVNQALQSSPRVIGSALGISFLEIRRFRQFVIYSIEGLIPQVATPMAAIAEAVVAYKKYSNWQHEQQLNFQQPLLHPNCG